jgi:ABC-2 type transport system ATP-binding protein
MDEAQSNPPLLTAEHVHVQFGQLVAVRDVSLQVNGGDLLGLIGPNGAGKTTLLRSIAALQPIHYGTVNVLGEPIRPDATDILRHIGFTPDTPSLYDELTVRDFLRFIAKGYDIGHNDAEERIDFWLEKVWLTEKANTKIKGLSRGMKQRIGIARTLLPNPSLILLDEPAAGLDPAGRVQFRQLLSNLRDQGKGLIVSSHILSDMDEYCTHIAIMAGGRVVQYGTVSHVAGHATNGRCRYTMMLAHPIADIKEQMGKIDAISGIEVDNQRIVFEYASGQDRAAALLAELVARKLPVASFAPNAPGLEEAYLRTGIRQVD